MQLCDADLAGVNWYAEFGGVYAWARGYAFWVAGGETGEEV